MNRSSIIAALLLLAALARASDGLTPAPPLDVTHILEMTVRGADVPVSADVQLAGHDGDMLLTVNLPDGERAVFPGVQREEGALKFQWTRIADGKLAAVQFLGQRKFDGKCEGSFTGFVDGELRDDMSGTFVLIPQPPSDRAARASTPQDSPEIDSREMPTPTRKEGVFNPPRLDTPWTRWLVGQWAGSGESDAGTGQATYRAEMALGGQFLFVRGEGHDIKITAEQREYLKTQLHASEEEIARFQAEPFQGLEIYTVDLQTGKVIGYLFDSLRCMAKGTGQWQQDALTMDWKWARGQESTRVTKKLSKDRASIVEHITLPDGGTMEEKGEMVRKE